MLQHYDTTSTWPPHSSICSFFDSKLILPVPRRRPKILVIALCLNDIFLSDHTAGTLPMPSALHVHNCPVEQNTGDLCLKCVHLWPRSCSPSTYRKPYNCVLIFNQPLGKHCRTLKHVHVSQTRLQCNFYLKS